jgi:hemerythrin-like domain-containing protein
MKLTDRLKVEHGVFLRQLRALETLLKEHPHPAVLASAVETIATAEEYHSAIEDRLLYPLLAEALGADFEGLLQMGADHAHLKKLVETVRSGEFDEGTISEYIGTMRVHMEKEIHKVFRMAEQVITEEKLASSWDEEHIFEEAGQGALWLRKLGADRSTLD